MVVVSEIVGERPKAAPKPPSVPEAYRNKTTFHSFRIQVKDGHVFYVNHYLLAELSPVFEKLFFGGFKENREQKACLPIETVDSMNILLRFVFMGFDAQLEIKETDLLELMRLATLYDIKCLRNHCRNFIAKIIACAEGNIFNEQLVLMCEVLNVIADNEEIEYKDLRLQVADLLASANMRNLNTIKIWELVNDSKLLAHIVQTSAQNTYSAFNASFHALLRPQTSSAPVCEAAIFHCSTCEQFLCADHAMNACRRTPAMARIDRSAFKKK